MIHQDRTEEEWVKRSLPMQIKKLSPRLQKDLSNIPFPTNLGNIESTFIFGQVNTGKTIRAIFMMLEEEKQIWVTAPLIDHIYQTPSYKYIFISVPELINEIKSCFNNPDKSEQDVLNFYSDVYFLVLDDFGVEKASDWCLSTLFLILNRRYENLRKTIITSNFSLEELAIHLGDDRIPSRISRMCQIEEKISYKKQVVI
jgi:DNA replication protein DnaC